MNNFVTIFQKCIYCQESLICGDCDCLYPTTPGSLEELSEESGAACFLIIKEICHKIGIEPGVSLRRVSKQLLNCNKKISRNLICLASIYYTANLNFYFPIHALLRFSENSESACTLHQKFVKIWIKAGLDPPPENEMFIIDFIISRNRKLIPPKFSQDIFVIMRTIKNVFADLKESTLKLPSLLVLAIYFHAKTSCETIQVCELLGISKNILKKNISFAVQCKQIISALKSLDICIDL